MVGTIVLIRTGGEDDQPMLRPAMVVLDHGDGWLNLTVFIDGIEDQRAPWCFATPEEVAYGGSTVRRIGVQKGDAQGQWRPLPANNRRA